MAAASVPPELRRDVPIRKKLIEVALPLEAINVASAREKSIRHGHPSTLHLWWARRPLAAARAVIFAQMVDDPSANPDLFPTEKAQQKERQRLFRIIEDLVKWENTTNEAVLNRAREEIWQSWRRTCAQNADHPRAKQLFDRDVLPAFHDPFAGGGALPLEAQRLGLVAYASDLNPVAVLINKAMIEIPPKFAGMPPQNPEARKNPSLLATKWKGAQGLAEDVRYYGKWMRDEAEKRIGHLYPKIEITEEMAKDRKDLQPYVGQKLTVIAWLWSRTVKSPNPAFSNIDVPLASTFMLSNKSGKKAYVLPQINGAKYHFTIRNGEPKGAQAANGTRSGSGAHFLCMLSGAAITPDYIRAEGRAGRLGTRLMAVVVEGLRKRIYLEPTPAQEAIAKCAAPQWIPDTEFFQQALGFRVGNYGMSKWSDLFTNRQLVGLVTFANLVEQVVDKVRADTSIARTGDDTALELGGSGSLAYAEAVALYLAFAVDRMAMSGNSLVRWNPVGEKAQHCFGRQTLSMLWDFAEPNFLGTATGSAEAAIFYAHDSLTSLPGVKAGAASQSNAATQTISKGKLVSTDPPYYDNVGYADLSDFFYVWLRRSMRPTFPNLFATVSVPKSEELVATPARHGGSDEAEQFFLAGMTHAIGRIAEQSHPAFPITIYYAFRQSETNDDEGTSNTGWETFLEAVKQVGLSTTGTWPVRTEMRTRMRGMDSNALASSVVLVCRAMNVGARVGSRRDFLAALTSELPIALGHLQRGNIAPVDLAQAAIGPGMAIFTRYGQVQDSQGEPLTVKQALALINETLAQVLTEQEGDFDADTRWALTWFDQLGFAEGEFGDATVLARAKNTSVDGMVSGGFIASKRGKVRLLKPDELPEDWDPQTDSRVSAWETLHHLIRALESGGETAAASLLKKLGTRAEIARELAYRLYSIAERKKRAAEALQYNALVQSWLEIARLAQESPAPAAARDRDLFDER